LRELALHILDIAENSISAGADKIRISVSERVNDDMLEIVIEDNGKGMDPETLSGITDPFITSRTTRKVGLGIPFLKAAAEACDGTFDIQSSVGYGTTVQATFKHSHIDRMPLGDISGTLQTLIIGTPEVNWVFEYHTDAGSFVFDDKPIKDTLDGVPLSEPAVMRFIREMLDEGIQSLHQQVADTITSGH
jgi:anti-sigma regulatory factor (Ser/Thr protein kinase)